MRSPLGMVSRTGTAAWFAGGYHGLVATCS